MNRWVLLGVLGIAGLFVAYSTTGEYRRASLWGDKWRGTPLTERVHILPQNIADALRGSNFAAGFGGEIAPAENAEYMLEDLREAIDSIPEPVKRLVEDRLIGVYLVQEMKLGEYMNAAGLAFKTINFFHQYAGTVILLDSVMMEKSPDRSLAGRSFVPFDQYGYYSMETDLADSGSNDRVTTLRTVLLHELGHHIDYDRGIVPESFSYGDIIRPGCGFTCLSWKRRGLQRGGVRLRTAFAHLKRGEIKEYALGMPKTLEALKASNFPSLYGAMQPEEDFAESFAMYVHTVMMDLPWEITFRIDGEIKAEIGSCFTDGRCPRKRKFFDALLAKAGS